MPSMTTFLESGFVRHTDDSRAPLSTPLGRRARSSKSSLESSKAGRGRGQVQGAKEKGGEIR